MKVRSITSQVRNTLLAFIATTCLAGVSVEAIDYRLDPSNESDTVSFRSRAKLEFIEGATNQIDGYVKFNPANSREKVSGVLEVDLTSLKTGIDIRDEHMRDRHLHTDKYPKAWFKFTSVSGLPEILSNDTTYQAIAEGAFYIHGVYRQVEARLTVKRLQVNQNESLQVTASFEIVLDDFDIKRPRALFMKLAKVIEVQVIFKAEESETIESISLPDWKSKD